MGHTVLSADNTFDMWSKKIKLEISLHYIYDDVSNNMNLLRSFHFHILFYKPF